MMPMYPVYGGYPYPPAMANPFQPQQNRLQEMEQQYQNGQNQQQPVQQPMQPMPNPQQNYPQFVKCRAVTSVEEARASLIDLDGSLHVFTDIGNKRIYTKQVGLDGTAPLKTYVLQEDEPKRAEKPAEPEINLDGFVRQEELDSVCASFAQQIDDLQDQLKGYERAFALMKEEKKPATKTTGGAKK